MIKSLKISLKIFILMLTLVCYKVEGQVNGFNISNTTTAANPVNLGVSFPVNISFNWTSTTTSSSIVIAYNNSLVSYNSACQTSLPSCMSISNSGSAITISINNLNSCVNTTSINFNVCFQYKCPDSCVGVTKPSIFNGTITDNFGTSQSSNTTSYGILPNNFSLTNSFSAYNPITSEVTFRACFSNPSCYNIRNPVFTIDLTPNTLGTITSVYGTGYTYTLTGGNTVTPNTSFFGLNANGCIYYVVKLPCGTGLGQVLSSNVTLSGVSCGIPNSIIRGPIATSYTIPSAPVASTSIGYSTAATSSYFYYYISNTGNSPINMTITSFLPLVKLTSVTASSNQVGLVQSNRYFDCVPAASVVTNLTNAVNSTLNIPTNTKMVEHTITNLQPGNYITLQKFYSNASSCNGAAGTPPYKDSLNIVYTCVPQANQCVPCGTGGVINPVLVYNPSPVINCQSSNNIAGCKNIGDTINLCYQFNNTGDLALTSGQLNVGIPAGLQVLPATIAYTGFTPTNPTVNAGSNLIFSLPTIPVSATTSYSVCFRAVVQTGVVAGSNTFYTYISGSNLSSTYLCGASFTACAYAAIGISKKVKGNLNTGFVSTGGQGQPNTNVDYEITLRNTGTVPINNLEVIDRIPAVGNLTILGSPNSAAVPNQFNMQMLAVPSNPDFTTSYTSLQNICTGWTGVGTPCNGNATSWGTALANGGVKFSFTPTFTLAAGATKVFTFQTKIPASALNNQVDCNTVGFIATPTTGGLLNPAESAPVCITVSNPCPPVTPAFTTTQACVNDTLKVTATSTFTGAASHEWSLMQTTTCGSAIDVIPPVMFGSVQTTQNAVFNIPNLNVCYYIKHRIFSTSGCIFDTTIRVAITLPISPLTISSNLKDSTGVIKDNFCVGENVYLDGTASIGETQYTIQILRRLSGSISPFTNFVSFTPFIGTAGNINLTQLLLDLPTPRYFEPQYEYNVLFTISKPGTCTAPKSTKNTFKIFCCEGYINANFQLNVAASASSYTITPVIFNGYAGANPTHEWYVLSSPNSGAGPYTPVFSTTAATFTLPNVQYNLYYTVIHKLKTICGEYCVGREQFQTNRSTEAVTVDCCLATQFWANGAGTDPHPLSAEFVIGTTPLGGGSSQFSIETYPTFTYGNNPSVTHEWFVLSSPNTSGGPYTAVGHSTDFNYTFSPASTGLYYFVIHKVKTPCGEVCFGKSVCIDCGGTCSEKCQMCGDIDCKLLDEVWPACYPPVNLVSNCRREYLTWDVVPSAFSYDVELSYNDPNCCESIYRPSSIIHTVDLNYLKLGDYVHPKFNCIRWRVRANCEKGEGIWSDWSCYYCDEIIIIQPEFPLIAKTQNAADINPAIKTEPKVSPNPNFGIMNIQMETKTELVLSVEAYNSQGLLIKTIKENRYPDGKFFSKLDLGNNIAKGLYLVVFKTNFGTFSKKVIIH